MYSLAHTQFARSIRHWLRAGATACPGSGKSKTSLTRIMSPSAVQTTMQRRHRSELPVKVPTHKQRAAATHDCAPASHHDRSGATDAVICGDCCGCVALPHCIQPGFGTRDQLFAEANKQRMGRLERRPRYSPFVREYCAIAMLVSSGARRRRAVVALLAAR